MRCYAIGKAISMLETRPIAPTEKKYYVYTLSYPDTGVVFYVGKGTVRTIKGLRERIDDHEAEAQQGVKSAKCAIIRDIWARGLHVQKAKVFETDNEEEAIVYEQALIRLMDGNNILTNVRAARGTNVASFYPDVPLQEETKSKRIKMPSEEPIDAEEAAKMLGVTARTVTRLAERGEIPGFRVGRLWKFRRRDIQEYIESQIRHPPSKPIDDQ
jgi:excisionase family DNA binding protein